MYHVIPINDRKLHEEESTCRCNPSVKLENGEMICIHNAYDSREIKERAKIGMRIYHVAFGWGTIHTYFKGGDTMLVDLDALEADYYVMGKGRVQMKGKNGKGIKTLHAPIEDFVWHPDKMTDLHGLRAMCIAAKLKFPKGYIPDHEKKINGR